MQPLCFWPVGGQFFSIAVRGNNTGWRTTIDALLVGIKIAASDVFTLALFRQHDTASGHPCDRFVIFFRRVFGLLVFFLRVLSLVVSFIATVFGKAGGYRKKKGCERTSATKTARGDVGGGSVCRV
jgi:hypothetical protein